MAASLEFMIDPQVKTNSMKKVNEILTKSSPKFKKFENVGVKAYNKVKSSTKMLIKKQEEFNKKFGKTNSNLKKMAGLVAGAFTVAAVKNFYSESIAGAEQQLEAETKLAAILGNVAGLKGNATAIAEGTDMLKNYASQLQEVGVIGDEVTIAGQAQLATFNLMPSTIKTLSAGMLDVIANTKGLKGTQQDAQGTANLLGKVMMGQSSALTRVGITLSDAQAKSIELGNEQERAAILAEVLEQNVGGVNAALAKTDPGKVINATNAWGDMKEEVGKGVLPALANVYQSMKGNIPEIQAGILSATNFMINMTATVWKFRKPILAVLGAYTIFSTAVKINSFILGVNAAAEKGVWIAEKAVAATKFLLGGRTSLLTAKTVLLNGVTMAATAGQWLLNAAMTANPIGLLIAGVALLGAGFALAYKKIEPFRNFINGLWEKITNSTFGKIISKIFGGGSSEIKLTDDTKDQKIDPKLPKSVDQEQVKKSYVLDPKIKPNYEKINLDPSYEKEIKVHTNYINDGKQDESKDQKKNIKVNSNYIYNNKKDPAKEYSTDINVKPNYIYGKDEEYNQDVSILPNYIYNQKEKPNYSQDIDISPNYIKKDVAIPNYSQDIEANINYNYNHDGEIQPNSNYLQDVTVKHEYIYGKKDKIEYETSKNEQPNINYIQDQKEKPNNNYTSENKVENNKNYATDTKVSNFKTNNSNSKSINNNIVSNVNVSGGIDSKILEKKVRAVVEEHNRQQLVGLGGY